ncbi:hypothetical protein PUN28_002480 [Cardiocondyla obscurior]|uniref:Uncharacterized protein n=1 Tax=Cardiocondyla obscurior TaxID=286306 RepID=A0AAW2GUL4_9HYME
MPIKRAPGLANFLRRTLKRRRKRRRKKKSDYFRDNMLFITENVVKIDFTSDPFVVVIIHSARGEAKYLEVIRLANEHRTNTSTANYSSWMCVVDVLFL